MNEVCHHKFFVEDQDGEVKLLSVVESHELIDDFGQLMHFFAEFDAFFSDHAINGHHTILFRFMNDLNFTDSFNFLGKFDVAFSSKFSQLGTVDAL